MSVRLTQSDSMIETYLNQKRMFQQMKHPFYVLDQWSIIF